VGDVVRAAGEISQRYRCGVSAGEGVVLLAEVSSLSGEGACVVAVCVGEFGVGFG